ncbi:AAA family ATPase [Arcticibacter eurypsychrophilus]|uniref:AAA family ATPase n=1 Tax=Arcticibacter eurypsychrophilus TaxID=1434752 RepID=UPI00084D17B1|nr:AAA family ATPase [Arcticibacter eurypsychrophilus]
MEFVIKNCNNIDEGKIILTKNILNIRYGINGTGKSTISKAIKFGSEDQSQLVQLTPFKLIDTDTTVIPEVICPEEINTVLIFNEEYLNQFLYKEDELIANSYEIFIRTVEYQGYTDQIDNLLKEIKDVFSKNNELDTIIQDFEGLSKSFAMTQSGLSKSSPLVKGLKDGNRIHNIPIELNGYSKLIKDKSCVSWLGWQVQGEQFLSISDDCPYCTSSTKDKKEIIHSISKVYDRTVIKNFSIILDALKNLGDYFSKTANETLKIITEKQSGLEKAEEDYIIEIKKQIDNLLGKLKALKYISPISFAEDAKVSEILNGLKINLDLFDRFKSAKTSEILISLNNSLDQVLKKVGMLQGEINKQKSLLKKLIENHKKNINEFLQNAGYKYQVEIINNKKKDYKLILRHKDSTKILNGGKQHLSFGEKNAFSLVLFMYEALYKKPELIILDDPISSFDKNKKYAIMHMLFGKQLHKENIRNKTVLLLTHDLDPVIDTVKVIKEYSSICEAKYIYIDSGNLKEKPITKTDLLTFAQICKKALQSDISEIIKLIYLRRNYEIIDDLGDEYQILSNLFHKRGLADLKDMRKAIGNDLLEDADFQNGSVNIRVFIPDFDYCESLVRIDNPNHLYQIYDLAENNYVRINIFRLIYEDQLEEIPNVLRKFINESYHIENELICQLNPNDYDLVPSFIIDECTKYIEEKRNV